MLKMKKKNYDNKKKDVKLHTRCKRVEGAIRVTNERINEEIKKLK